MRGVGFSFWIGPSSECFVNDLHPDQFERSPFRVSYPKLAYFVQDMMDTQKWMEVQELVDGMDLDEEWGEENIDLDKPGEIEYAKKKNERIRGSLEKFPTNIPSTLRETPMDLRAKWRKLVRNKECRLPILAAKGRYITKYRRTGSLDPLITQKYSDYLPI